MYYSVLIGFSAYWLDRASCIVNEANTACHCQGTLNEALIYFPDILPFKLRNGEGKEKVCSATALKMLCSRV